jgi:hypothetical protein
MKVTNRFEVVGEAKVVDHVQRLQMKQKLFAFVLLSQEGVLFVECLEQISFVQQLTQMLGQALFLK